MAYINDTQQQYLADNDFGSYQFVSLDDVINQFMVVYVGEDKVIPKARRVDVAFHAQRALAELSFDTFKSVKSREIAVPATLQMILPQDYVNYTKLSWVDSSGIKHPIYPTKHTSNPPSKPLQDSDGDFVLQAIGDITTGTPNTTLTTREENILVGMRVSGGLLPKDVTISSVKHTSSTTLVRFALNGGVFQPTDDVAGAELTFTNSDGSLIKEPVETHIIIASSFNSPPGQQLTASSADDIASVKPGMLVYSSMYPLGTTVINVDSTKVTLSSASLQGTSNLAISGDSVVFVTPEFKESTAWTNYKSTTPSENNEDDYEDDVYWPNDGERYGLDPSQAQINGSFYIDELVGKIHFSSNISGKTVILDYISDSLGTHEEMKVHKFAEEAMYKHIACAVLSASAYGQQLVPRFKKERFAETRKAKLRLSNIKLEEITQVLRGKSKQIKH
jgi:hypothetical protein